MYKRVFGVLGLSALVLAGCNEDPAGPGRVACDTFLLSYEPAPGDTVSSLGVKYIDIEEGTGTVNAATNNWATVNFTGYLLSPEGQRFATSCDPQSTTLAYHVGTGQLSNGGYVIEGFSYGVYGMKIGGVRRVIIPAELAWGTEPDPNNPDSLAGKDVIFDLQLVRLQ
jgi:FKBP-type peptidyl-prolyl cis-trans isomerase FkpA